MLHTWKPSGGCMKDARCDRHPRHLPGQAERTEMLTVGPAWEKDTQRRIQAMGLWPKGLPVPDD